MCVCYIWYSDPRISCRLTLCMCVCVLHLYSDPRFSCRLTLCMCVCVLHLFSDPRVSCRLTLCMCVCVLHLVFRPPLLMQVEAGSQEVVCAAVEGLDALPLGARQHYLGVLLRVLLCISCTGMCQCKGGRKVDLDVSTRGRSLGFQIIPTTCKRYMCFARAC